MVKTVTDLDIEIRAFETRYEMKSETMRERFRAGLQKDTADISKWLLLLRLRERVRGTR